MGALCFIVHSKWASRTSGGSMGRFALARVVRSETQRRTAYRPTSLHQHPPTPTYTHSDGGTVTKDTDTKE
jgi:hypothetical protein